MSTEEISASRRSLRGGELKQLQDVLVVIVTLIVLLVMGLLLMTGLDSGSIRALLLAVSGLVGIVVAFAVFARPELGAFILIFTIFTNLSDILETQGFPSLNKPLVVLIAISLILNYFFRRRQNFRLQTSEILLTAFWIVGGLSFLVAADTAAVVDWTVDFAKDIVILMAIVYALHSRATWSRAYWVLVLSAAALALLGLYQVVTENYSMQFMGLAKVHFDSDVAAGVGAARLQGPIDDPNFYGQMMVSVLPLAIYATWNAKNRAAQGMAIIASLLIASAVIFSYSRGAFLALIFVLMMVLFTRVRSWSSRFLILLLIVPLFSLLPGGYIARVQTLVSIRPADQMTIYRENSLRGRSSEIQAGLLMWRDHPVLGLGADNFTHFYQEYAQQIGLEYRSEDRQAHSLYVQILAEMGILGAGLFASFLVSLFNSTKRTLKRVSSVSSGAGFCDSLMAIRIGIGAYLITSIFLHSDYFRYLILLVSLAIAANHLVDRAFSQRAIPIDLPARPDNER